MTRADWQADDLGLAGDERGAELAVARRHFIIADIAGFAAAARAIGFGLVVVRAVGDQIFNVLAAFGMALERDQAARKQRRRAAHRRAALVQRLGGFEPVFCEILADALIHQILAFRIHVTIVIIEHLHGIVSVTAGTLRLRKQVGGRFLIAVVFQNEDAALRPTPERPGFDELLFSPAGVVDGVIGQLGQIGDRLVARLGVREHQRVLAVGMLEEIIDSVLLHQPADEVEIRLAVLDAIFERGRRTGGCVAEIGEAAIGEDLLDDGDGRLLREDPAVGRPRQEPQPGPQHELVDVEVLPGSRPARLRHQTVEVALLVVLRLQHDGRAEAERGGEIEVGLRAHRLDVDFEQLAQALDGAEARQDQGVRTERRRELALTLVLGEGVGHRVLATAVVNGDAIIVQFRVASMVWAARRSGSFVSTPSCGSAGSERGRSFVSMRGFFKALGAKICNLRFSSDAPLPGAKGGSVALSVGEAGPCLRPGPKGLSAADLPGTKSKPDRTNSKFFVTPKLGHRGEKGSAPRILD